MAEILPPTPPGPDPDDLEELAAFEHSSWQGWAEHMLDMLEEELGDSSIPDAQHALKSLPCVKRWRRQIVQHYSELPESERESDRDQARMKAKLYRR